MMDDLLRGLDEIKIELFKVHEGQPRKQQVILSQAISELQALQQLKIDRWRLQAEVAVLRDERDGYLRYIAKVHGVEDSYLQYLDKVDEVEEDADAES